MKLTEYLSEVPSRHMAEQSRENIINASRHQLFRLKRSPVRCQRFITAIIGIKLFSFYSALLNPASQSKSCRTTTARYSQDSISQCDGEDLVVKGDRNMPRTKKFGITWM